MSQRAQHFGGNKVTYLSQGIQNDIIECCGYDIRQQVLREVKVAKFYTVLTDEAADSSNWEQLPLVLRFVNNSPRFERNLWTSCTVSQQQERLSLNPIVGNYGSLVCNLKITCEDRDMMEQLTWLVQ